jgi:nucleotide-binding universal stress UspA family protein
MPGSAGLVGPSERAGGHWSPAVLHSMISSMATAAEWMSPRPDPTDPSTPQAFLDEHGTPGQPIGIRRLLLATDLSPASAQAAEEAIRLAVETGAQLLVLSVVDPRRLRLPGGIFLRRVDQERSRIEVGVQRLVDSARRAGARATFLVWEGEPAEAILAASDAEKVDVIVMGSHGRGLLGRLVLGSTSTRVSEMATCHVVVVDSQVH